MFQRIVNILFIILQSVLSFPRKVYLLVMESNHEIFYLLHSVLLHISHKHYGSAVHVENRELHLTRLYHLVQYVYLQDIPHYLRLCCRPL